jgi:hypothetical protein
MIRVNRWDLLRQVIEELDQLENESEYLVFDSNYDMSSKLVNAMENAVASTNILVSTH